MSDILSNSWESDIQAYPGSETVEKKGNFLDNLFKYADKALGLYKTATSDRPTGAGVGYDIDFRPPEEKKVLGMPPITGYIVIATVIGLLGYAVFAKKTSGTGKSSASK